MLLCEDSLLLHRLSSMCVKSLMLEAMIDTHTERERESERVPSFLADLFVSFHPSWFINSNIPTSLFWTRLDKLETTIIVYTVMQILNIKTEGFFNWEYFRVYSVLIEIHFWINIFQTDDRLSPAWLDGNKYAQVPTIREFVSNLNLHF